MTNFVGLILAGGAGRRFGEPKAFARLPDHRTFLEACAEAHANAGALLVAATLPPRNFAPIPESVLGIPLPQPNLDMFRSILAGAARLLRDGRWDAAIIHPVDHPLVTWSTIRGLADDTSPASIPTCRGKHGHPIRISRTIVTGIVDGTFPGPTLREVLREVGAQDFPVDDSGVRANCNTPETLAEAWRLHTKD